MRTQQLIKLNTRTKDVYVNKVDIGWHHCVSLHSYWAKSVSADYKRQKRVIYGSPTLEFLGVGLMRYLIKFSFMKYAVL